MSARPRARGRWAFALTVAAFCWALALIVAAFLLPVYQGVSASSDGHTTITRSVSSTLVDENGLRVLVPLALPALLVAVVWLLLHRRCSRGTRFGDGFVWALLALLAWVVLLTGFSVGTLLFPILTLLVAAAALTPHARS